MTADISGAKPVIRGELKLDVLDANKYLPPESASTGAASDDDTKSDGGGSADKPKPQEWSDDPIDLAGLQAVNLDFDLSVQGIRIRKIKIGESALGVAIKNGLLTADLRQLKLYEGIGRAELALDGRGATPSLRKSFTLTGVNAGTLLTDAADFDRLEGSGDIEISLSATGKSQKAMVQTLDGDGAIKFVDGAIRGINLAQMIRNVTSAFTDTGGAQKTDFAELSGTFKITRGNFRNDDLLLLNPLLRVNGAGTADLPKRTVKYRIEPKAVGSLEGQGGEAALKGIRRAGDRRGPLARPQLPPRSGCRHRRRSRQGHREPQGCLEGGQRGRRIAAEGPDRPGWRRRNAGGRWRKGGPTEPRRRAEKAAW